VLGKRKGIAVLSLKAKRPDGKVTFYITSDTSKSGYDPGSGSAAFMVN